MCCSHCQWYNNSLGSNTGTAKCLTTEEPTVSPTTMPFEPISSCLSSWVDEKVNLPSSLYVCDKNCADLQDCTDCDSNSMFHVLENFFSNGDFDHDDKISISECKMVVQFASSSLMLYWNGYDTEWEGLSYEGKCA